VVVEILFYSTLFFAVTSQQNGSDGGYETLPINKSLLVAGLNTRIFKAYSSFIGLASILASLGIISYKTNNTISRMNNPYPIVI
jgi:hypothetical protein